MELTKYPELLGTTDHLFTITPSGSATSVYIAATPGANWSLCTAGSVSVYTTFIDLTNV